jgi:tetratricopeptide (TPR) repeat protein
MMRRCFSVVILLLFALTAGYADFAQTIVSADSLHDQGQYLQARAMLLEAAASASAKEQAELYWRASRETLEIGDQADKAKKPVDSVLKIFEEGQGYANMAMSADPDNCLGYYWKSALIGRWGQVKGIFDSLGQAAPMKELLSKDISLNPRHADAYFVFGQLYRELPGWPLSFGNMDYAVSLGRMAVDLNAEQVRDGTEKEIIYSFETELAKTLYKRNWSSAARLSEQKNKLARFTAAKDLLEKGWAYEGTVQLPNVSDREEAKTLVKAAIAGLEDKANRTVSDDKDLATARDVLKGW